MGRVSLRVGRWKLSESGQTSAAIAAHSIAAAAAIQLDSSAASTPSSQLQQPSPPLHPVIFSVEDDQLPTPSSPTPPLLPTVVASVRSSAEAAIVDDSAALGRSDLSPVTEEPSSSGADQRSLLDDERRSGNDTIEMVPDLYEDGADSLLIELKKVPDQQLGMGIGKRPRGILVTSLQPGSAAAEKLRVGDRLLGE
jgi:multiple PDZ domain protein